MYQENAGFDQPAPIMMMMSNEEDGFSQTHIPNRNTNPNFSVDDAAAISAMEMELQNQLNMEMDQCYTTTTTNNNNNNEIQQIVQEMSSFNGPSSSDYVVQNGHYTTTTDAAAAAPHDLLNMFPPLPNNPSIAYSNHHKSSSSFLASLGLYGDNPTAADIGPSGVVYDPLLPLNLPPQPPLLRDLFHNMPPPHGGYNGHNMLVGGSRNNNNGCNLFDDQRENGSEGFFYQNNENGVFEFSAGGGGEMNNINMNINRDLMNGKDSKHYTTERHRRVLMNDKFHALRSLLANPTKNDRASIVADAIAYINELKRSVGELKLLVEKKRCVSERMKRLKIEDAGNDEGGINGDSSKSLVDMDHHPCNGSTLRSSWLHRKSKNTEVDVRIIDDEVTVKLVQQKRINCLLFVSKVLDELQLDLHHVAGGLIGDYYSFLFNSKICEGSIVYASAIANKLIEVVDKHYAAIPPTSSY